MYVISRRFAGQPVARFKAGLAGLAITTLLVTGAAAHANLVQNAGFTSNSGLGQLGYNTNATDWTTSGYNFLFSSSTPTGSVPGQYGGLALTSGVTADPHGGAYFVGLDGAYDQGPLTQSISGLTVGDVYDLTFDWAASQQTGFTGATTQRVQVSLGSQTKSTATYNLPSQGFSGWMPVSMDFTATSTTETLSFLAVSSPQLPPFTLLDDISLTTPEPESFALLLTGLLVGAGLLKSRRWLRAKR